MSNLSNDSVATSSKNTDLVMHERVSIKDHWMENTRFLSYIQTIEKKFESSPRLLAQCKDKESCKHIIRRLATRSKHHEGQRVLRKLWEIGDSRRQKRHYVIAAYLQILEYDTSDGCWAVVERVMDRIYRCQSAQKQAFTLVIQHGALSYGKKKESSHASFTRKISSPVDAKVLKLEKKMRVIYQTALRNIHIMAEDFLDTHKENAFKSALHEPARFYFHLCGNAHHRDHVNVHGLNGYLCLVRGWFGCQMPLSPLSSDNEAFKGCADVWSGLSDNAWEIFQDEANFGKDFEGMKGLKKEMLTNRSHGGYNSGHTFIGEKAADMEDAARTKDPRYLKYANKFAFFFEKEFFVKRMFEVLNAEGKPEYSGFQKACEVLYPLFKQEHGFTEDNFLEVIYDEEYNLDVDKAARFFWFCGICKESEAQITWLNKCEYTHDSIDNTCPICYEERDDIEQIPHWNAKGDISSHKMCRDCTRQYNKNDCPFCKEVCLKDNILNGIKGFIDEVKNRQLRSDHNELAALFEMWQIFEMEYANNPKIIHRVAKHVVQDSNFKELLQGGVDSKAGWIRDAAGTIFRLHSLSMEGSLDINDDEKLLLARSYETIMQVARRGNECGHFYGALYSQAMAPYVCALQSGQSTTHLETIIKEVGSTIVNLYKSERGIRSELKREIPERIIVEYMPIVTMSVWGGERKDPVWKAFF